MTYHCSQCYILHRYTVTSDARRISDQLHKFRNLRCLVEPRLDSTQPEDQWFLQRLADLVNFLTDQEVVSISQTRQFTADDQTSQLTLNIPQAVTTQHYSAGSYGLPYPPNYNPPISGRVPPTTQSSQKSACVGERGHTSSH